MRRTSPLPEAVRQMIHRYRSGRTLYEVADEFGVHRETVARHLRKAGVRLRRQGLDPAGVERAGRLYERGITLAQVGAGVRVSAGTVRRALLAEGMVLRPPLIPRTEALDPAGLTRASNG